MNPARPEDKTKSIEAKPKSTYSTRAATASS